MDGCTLIILITKFGCIPKGMLETPLDRVRGQVRKKYISEHDLSLSDYEGWNNLHNTLNEVFIYPL